MNVSRKISNIVLLARCLAYAFFRGRADKVPKNISKIIVVPAGKLGDVVCTTPVLEAIRKHLPRVEIIVAGSTTLHEPLLAHSGLVDAYLELDQQEAIERIKECAAGVALVTGPTFKVTALLYLAGIPLVIAPRVIDGYSPLETRTYNVLKKLVTTVPYTMGAYAPRERLRTLEPLGIISEDVAKHLGFSETAGKEITRFFHENRIEVTKDFVVGISPSAGNKIKEWPEERFAAVMDHLIEKYQLKIVLIGGPNDRLRVQRVLTQLKHPAAVINTQGQLTLDELKALISMCNLFIAVDTGPIYIAEAFGIPTIDIVGPMNEHEQPPQGFIHRNVLPPHRIQPQLGILNARRYDKEEALRQTLSITTESVIEETDLLIRNLRIRERD